MRITIPTHMFATIPAADTSNAMNYDGAKERTDTYLLIAVNPTTGDLETVVDCRCWMGKSRNSSIVYASIWIRGGGRYLAGKGTAGGYGYHKSSAAIDAAITSAGVELFGTPYQGHEIDITRKANIAGVGEMAIQDALLAIGAALGYTTMHFA